MKNYKIFLLLLFIFSISELSAASKIYELSNGKISDNEVHFYRFKITKSSPQDSIEFALIGDPKNGKPTLLYIEGSGLTPSFVRDSLNQIYYTSFQSIFTFLDSYNLLIPSKYGIPICSDLNYLDANYEYSENGNVPVGYIQNSNLVNYTRIFNDLKNSQSKRSKNENFFVMGHSQGARIALTLMKNKHVKAGIYMSADPLGRFASIIDSEYSGFENRNNDRYEFYESLINCSDCPSDSLFRNESIESWKSFSTPSMMSFSEIKKPLLITYGDMDVSCPNCYIFDIIQLYQENINVIKYKGYDHNYFLNKEKKIDKVYIDIKTWISKHNQF